MVLCSGCFDGIHIGHVKYLMQARGMARPGEKLCVAVATNEYIRKTKKREPIWPFEERAFVVNAILYVNAVIGHNEAGVAHRIYELRPRLLVKGADWEGRLPPDVRAACEAVGCDIVFVDSGIQQHTSDALSS